MAVHAQPGTNTFRSAEQRTALVELYTSEGCSSCPPAEAWLSGLKTSPRLWRDFVPVAFHVDYWDSLGWRDPWSKRAFADRQRDYAALWRSDSIYTPGFVLNGREWRGWSRRPTPPTPITETAGVLSVLRSNTNHWQVQFAPTPGRMPDRCTAHVALLACGLSSNVKAGENRGRRLEHDFVVLSLTPVALAKQADVFHGEFDLPTPATPNGQRLALAVWVTHGDSLEPMQATGGWLTPTTGTKPL